MNACDWKYCEIAWFESIVVTSTSIPICDSWSLTISASRADGASGVATIVIFAPSA